MRSSARSWASPQKTRYRVSPLHYWRMMYTQCHVLTLSVHTTQWGFTFVYTHITTQVKVQNISSTPEGYSCPLLVNMHVLLLVRVFFQPKGRLAVLTLSPELGLPRIWTTDTAVRYCSIYMLQYILIYVGPLPFHVTFVGFTQGV